MAEQRLENADVDLLFEQVSCEAVAKRVHRHPLVDAGRQGGGLNSAIELARAQRLDRVEARKQPAAVEHLALCPGDPPPHTQPLQQQAEQVKIVVA